MKTPKSSRLNKRIAILFSIGFFLIIIATFIFTYLIPQKDSEIMNVDGQITDSEFMFLQAQFFESMTAVPYNIRKIIDMLPSPKSFSDNYQEFMDEEAKIKRNILIMLSWPDNPTKELLEKWKGLNANHLEAIKVKMFPLFMERVNNIIDYRKELISTKQSLLLWSTIAQLLGLLLTQIGVITEVLKK